MDNQEILEIAMKQSAIDLSCEKSDFERSENVIVTSKVDQMARKYLELPFDTVKKEYHSNQFYGTFEIVSLTGTISQKEDKVYLHVHMSAGDDKGNVFGGHLNSAIVSATAEIVIRFINGTVNRRFDEEIGLNLFQFSRKNSEK